MAKENYANNGSNSSLYEKHLWVDFGRYIDIIIRHKIIIIACLIIIPTIVILLKLKSPPTYKAQLSLLLEGSSEVAATLGDISGIPLTSTTVTTETEARLIKTDDSFLQKILKKLNLKDKKGHLLTIDALSNIIDVKVDKESDKILWISAQDNTPQGALKIANTIGESYVEHSRSFNESKIKNATEFIEKQLAKAEKNLTISEDLLAAFEKNEKITDIGELAKSYAPINIAEIEIDRNRVKASLRAAEAKRDQIKNLLRTMSGRKKTVLTTDTQQPEIDTLKAKLSSLESELIATKAIYTDTSTEVTKLEAQIEETKKMINKKIGESLKSYTMGEEPTANYSDLLRDLQSVESEIISLQTNYDSLGFNFSEYNNQFNSVPQKKVTYQRLQRNLELNKHLYNLLREKREGCRIAEAMKLGGARILKYATLPTKSITGDYKFLIVFSLFFAFVVGICAALMLEYLEDRIISIDEAKETFEKPVLCTIPHAKVSANNGGLANIIPHKMLENPIFSQCFQTLLINMKFANIDHPNGSYFICSSIPKEGKTTVTANLGMTLGHTRKTLIVDADLRKPTLNKLFHVENKAGLTDVLAGKISLAETIIKIKGSDLSMLPSGTIPANPISVLDSKKVAQLVRHLEEIYEIVLYDTPPLAVVPDSLLIGHQLKGCIVVLCPEETKRRAVLQTKQALDLAQINIVGVVLNKIVASPSRSRYYYQYHKYYPYYHSSSKSSNNIKSNV